MLAIGCLRCLNLFNPPRSARNAKELNVELRLEILLRRELYTHCVHETTVVTICLLISLPAMYFWWLPMKFTLPWLKEHLDTGLASEIVDKLTMIGLEVESVEDKAARLKPFAIANVISAEKHPNADRLRVCMVDIRRRQADPGRVRRAQCARRHERRVLGARHLHSRQEHDAGGRQDPRRRKPRHVAVRSRDEISDDHDGIVDLPADAPVGKPYVEWAGPAEPVIEIKLTPNRSDCTGDAGIARDLGATLIGDYKEKRRSEWMASSPVRSR